MAGGHSSAGTRSGRSQSVISTRYHRFDLAGGPSCPPRHAKVNFARGRSRPGLTRWPCAPPRQCPPERVCEGPCLPQGRKRAAPAAPLSPRAPLSRNGGHPQGSRLSIAAETRPAGADPPPRRRVSLCSSRTAAGRRPAAQSRVPWSYRRPPRTPGAA